MNARRWELPGLTGLAILAFWCHLQYPLNHDLAWFYYQAEGVAAGGRLYVDFVDVNFPFASLSLLPAVWIARLAGLPGATALILYGIAVAILVTLLCRRLLDRFGLAAWVVTVFSAGVFVAITILPGYAFLQRDPFVAMLALPYLFCAALRAAQPPPRIAAVSSGLLMGFAVVIKPPYALLLLPVELLMLYRFSWRGLLRTESIAGGLFAVLAVALTFQDHLRYLQSVLPWLIDLYGAYANRSATLRNALPATILLALAGFIRWPGGDGPIGTLRRLLLIQAVVALAIFLIQDKGWTYQLVPAKTLLEIGLFALVADGFGGGGRQPLATWRRSAAAGDWRLPLMLGLLLASCGLQLAREAPPDEATAALRDRIAASPGPFLILTTDLWPGFPIAVVTDKIWASRWAHLVMLPGIIRNEAKEGTSTWEAPMRAAILEDLRRYRPALIFVPTDPDTSLPAGFDLLDWLRRDPGFDQVWSGYHTDGTVDGFAIWRLG
jgi:hypothetical protein